MFTGIVETIGNVRRTGKMLEIAASGIFSRCTVGDSISVNGICLTATHIREGVFHANPAAETLARTTLGHLKPGDAVNLETALTLAKPLGGHLLMGHVDTVGEICRVEKNAASWTVHVRFSDEFLPWVVPRGSLGVDGISLTIAEVKDACVHLALIPHTLENTTLSFARAGQRVNLEFDILAKYVDRWMACRETSTQRGGTLTMEHLREGGW